MNVTRVCNKCGEVNLLDSVSIKHVDVYDECGVYYRFTYYICKRCKEVVVVQIDNMKTINIVNSLKQLLLKSIEKKRRNETISPKWEKKKNKYTKQLKAERELLERVCTGRTFKNDCGEIFINCLTMYKGDVIIDDEGSM